MQLDCRLKVKNKYRCLVSEGVIRDRTGIEAEIEVIDGSCQACLRAPEKVSGQHPQSLNYMTASLIIGSKRAPQLTTELLKYTRVYKITKKDLERGPGTELHKILLREGYKIEPGCDCIRWMAYMNWGGPVWCYQNLDRISDVMYKEFERRQPLVSKIVPASLAKSKAKDWILEALATWEKIESKERSDEES